jgi:hypothetical protein
MKKLITIIGGVALVGILLVGLTGCLKLSPQKVIKKMLAEMSEVDSFSLDLNAEIDGSFPGVTSLQMPGDSLEEGSIAVRVDGDFSSKKEDSVAYAMNVEINYNVGEEAEGVKGAFRYLDSNFYANLSEVPNIGFADLSTLKDIWYRFDMNSFDSTKSEDSSTELSDAQMKKFKKLVKKIDFLKITEDYGVENLEGADVYHFAAKIDKKEMKKFAIETTKIMEDRDLSGEELDDLSNSLDAWEEIEAELWIGKKDYLLYRVMANGESKTDEAGSKSYEVTANLSDFDHNREIVKPENVREFDMMSLFMPSFSNLEGMEGLSTSSSGNVNSLQGIEGIDTDELQKQMEELQQQLKDQGYGGSE